MQKARLALPLILILGLWGPLLARAASPPQTTHAGGPGTFVLRGQMASATTLTMTGQLSVGSALNLTWDLPLITSLRLNGYTEAVVPPSFVFNVAPNSFEDLTIGVQRVRRFHWTAPPANSLISVTETVHLAMLSQLTPFRSSASYPMIAVPTDVQPYLRMTPGLQLPASARGLVNQLRRGKTTERSVVAAVANWVAAHTRYNRARSNGPFDAASVLAYHEATCRGYDDLMAGLLRSLGIPSQVVFGWITAQPISVPAQHHTVGFLRWSIPGTAGEAHTWLNVYFPDVGWVPFDPQHEQFFVDPRHLGFFTAVDAAVAPSLGAWTEQNWGTDVHTGKIDVIPGESNASRVTIQSRDTGHVVLYRLRRNASTEMVLSR